jgi:hypothetical protein
MIIFGHHFEMLFPLMAVVLPAISAIVRYSMLFAGLIATLSKSVKADRPHIFREFARAMTVSRLRHNASSASGSNGGPR